MWQGELDLMVPLAHGRWLAQHIPHVRSRMVAGHGHISLVTRYPGSVLVVAGSADESATVAPDVLAATPGQVKEAIIINGADHIFNVLDDDQTAATQLLEATVQWLRATRQTGENRKAGLSSTRQRHQ